MEVPLFQGNWGEQERESKQVFYYVCPVCCFGGTFFKRCIAVVGALSILAVTVSQAFVEGIASLFVSSNPDTLSLAVHGLHLFALMYFFDGISIFLANFFAVLCRGNVAFILSLLRAVILKGRCCFIDKKQKEISLLKQGECR